MGGKTYRKVSSLNVISIFFPFESLKLYKTAKDIRKFVILLIITLKIIYTLIYNELGFIRKRVILYYAIVAKFRNFENGVLPGNCAICGVR